MLVVTRTLNESIVIADDVEVKVLGVRKGEVRLGIDAPRDVEVNRKEVKEQGRTRPQGSDARG